MSPHSSKLKPMRTLLEEQFSREDHHLSEESDTELKDEEIIEELEEVNEMSVDLNKTKSDELNCNQNSDENERQTNCNDSCICDEVLVPESEPLVRDEVK